MSNINVYYDHMFDCLSTVPMPVVQAGLPAVILALPVVVVLITAVAITAVVIAILLWRKSKRKQVYAILCIYTFMYVNVGKYM